MDPLSAWSLDTVVRASVPLLCGLLLARLFVRGPAALRHRAWTLAVVGALAIPALCWLPPAWHVGVLPGPGGEAASAPASATTARLAQAPERGPRVEPETAHPAAATPRDLASGPVTAAAPRVGRGVPWRALALGAWWSGVLLGLAWLAVGVLRVRRLAATAEPVFDANFERQVERLCARLGITRRPRLLVSRLVATPMTFGHLRPVVLLPESARGWSPERREVVLTHELCHVRRRDWAAQVLAQVARSLYWFHPLAWLAFRRMAVERERACDEAVVALGTPPSVYAEHLLELALGLSPGERVGAAALAMVHPTQLEGRLMSILDKKHDRSRRLLLLVPLTATMLAAAAASATARTWQERRVEVAPTPPRQEEQGAARAGDEARERPEYAYYRLQNARDSKSTRISGRMFGRLGDERPGGPPVYRNSQEVEALFAEALPVLRELEPHERELDALQAEMEPLQEQVEAIHAEMEPLQGLMEEVHGRMEPFHERIERLHGDMEPGQEEIEAIHRGTEALHERQERLQEQLEPYHEQLDRIHGEMEGLHEQQERLYAKLEPFQDRMQRLHAELEQLHGRMENLDARRDAGRIDALRERVDALRGEIESEQERTEPVRRELEALFERMEPFHARIEAVQREMEPVHEAMSRLHAEMEPFHREIERVHRALEPQREAIEHVHEEMEPLHRELEQLHGRMEPFHERLETWHERMEPFHERMEPIHERMEPLWERLEPIWERMNAAVERDLGQQWQDAVERSGLADERLRTALVEARQDVLDSISWGWALSRDPWELSVQTGRRSAASELDEALRRVLGERGVVLDETSRTGVEQLARDFADTLLRLRYAL